MPVTYEKQYHLRVNHNGELYQYCDCSADRFTSFCSLEINTEYLVISVYHLLHRQMYFSIYRYFIIWLGSHATGNKVAAEHF